MTGHRRVVLLLAGALAACAAPGGAPRLSPAGERLRGQLVWGHEVRSFRACHGGEAAWVVDATEGDLAAVAGVLVTAPYQPLFVEVRGEPQAVPDAGFASAYSNAIRITALLRAEREGFGCQEDLAGIRILARGNEPAWRVELRDDGVSFSSLASPERLDLPAPEAERSESGLSFRAADGEDRIEVLVSERRCIDSMSGSHFELTATVRRGDSELRGCAVRGSPSR